MSGNAQAAQVPAPPGTTPPIGTPEGRTAVGPARDFANARTDRPPGIDAMAGYRAPDVPGAVHRGLPASRLTREFSRFAGLAPGAWIREEFRNIQDGGHGAAEDRLHG